MRKSMMVLWFAVVGFAAAMYPSTYDNMDVDEVLTNCRLLQPYWKCVLEETTKCTKQANELKKYIVDALQKDCADCTDTQKEKGKKVIGVLATVHKDVWKKLRDKYDPTNKYFEKHEAEFNEAVKAGTYDKYPECPEND